MSTVQQIVFIILAVIATVFCFFTFYLFVKIKKEKIEYQQKINSLTEELRYDYMTGTLSRRTFIEEMETELANNPNGMLLIFDINNFKNVNDTLGHGEGDNLIKRYSAKLQKAFEKNLVGRLGGDEFIVFISGECDKKELTIKLKKSGVTEFFDKPTKLIMTSCCGVATAPNNGSNFEELYKMADKALYRAKNNSNNIIYCKS